MSSSEFSNDRPGTVSNLAPEVLVSPPHREIPPQIETIVPNVCIRYVVNTGTKYAYRIYGLLTKHAKLNVVVTVTAILPVYATDAHVLCAVASCHEMDPGRTDKVH